MPRGHYIMGILSRTKSNIFISLIFLLLAVNTHASQSRDAWNIWRQGFNVYENGEDQILLGKTAESLQSFKTALGHFNRITTKYPKWKTKLIAYRVGLCERKIKTINNKIARSAKVNGTGGEHSSLIAKAIESSRQEQLLIELDLYKNKFYTTSAALELAKREASRNKQAAQQLPLVLKEKADLEIKKSILKKQYQELAQNTNMTAQVGKNKDKELTAINAALTNSKHQVNQLKSQLEEIQTSRQNLESSDRLMKAQVEKEFEKKNQYKQESLSLKHRLSQAEKQREALHYEMGMINESHLHKTKVLNQKEIIIAELETLLNDLQQKSDLAGVTRQLKSENARMTADKKKLYTQVYALEKEKSDLKHKLSRSVANIVELSEKFSEQQSLATAEKDAREKLTIQQELDGEQANTNVSMLKTFQEENNKLKLEVINLSKNFSTLKKKYDLSATEKINDQSHYSQLKLDAQAKLKHLNTKFELLSSGDANTKEKQELLTRLDQVNLLKNNLAALQQEDKIKGEQLSLLVTEKNRLELEYMTLQVKLKDSPSTIKDTHSRTRFMNEIKKLSGQLTKIQNDNLSLRAQVKNGNSTAILQAKEKVIDQLNNTVSQQTQTIETLTQSDKEAQATISQLKQTDRHVRKTPGALATDSKLLAEVKALSAAKSKLKSITAAYKKKLTQAKMKYGVLVKKLKQSETMEKTYKSNLSNLSARFDAMQESIQSNKEIIVTRAAKTKSMKEELTKLKAENAQLDTMVTKLDLKTIISDNNSLKQALSDNKMEMLNLSQQIKDLKRIKVNPDVALLLRQVERKNTAIDELISQIEELKEDNDGLSTTFEEIDRKLYKRNERLMQYKNWLDTKSKNFDALADIKNKLQKELQELRKK